MAWRLAKGLEKLRDQVNARWPNRSKSSDGSVGDTSHAARPSDHNPDGRGIVHAIDITHDPKTGFDSYAFADLLLKGQDKRISYIISNRRIGSGPGGQSPGKWRKYTGSNPHDHHVHISITKAGEDVISPWSIDGMAAPAPDAPPFVPAPPTLKPGATGDHVKKLQALLGCVVTGKYEPKSETEYALRLYQVRHKLEPDGVCGPQTWKTINT